MNGNQPSANVSPADVQEYLGGVDYPASKGDILDAAQQQDAPDEVINTLEQLPDNMQFNSPADMVQQIWGTGQSE